MSLKNIKKDFPIFLYKGPFVYLDSAATSQKPQSVIDALEKFYTHYNSNVHRGIYELGETATILYEQARDKVAYFINAPYREEIIFTSGATEGINNIAFYFATSILHPGDEILLTQAEHHANLLPWQEVTRKTGAVLKYIPINKETLCCENPENFLTNKTKFVSITSYSNIIGDIWGPEKLKEFIYRAHTQKAYVLVDAAQSIAHEKIDIQKLDPDFMVFSGHKVFGPTGIGVLYIKKYLHDIIPPFKKGGSMVQQVTFTDATWAPAPQKFEAGTPHISGAIGLGVALDYFTEHFDYKDLAQYESALCYNFYEGLSKISFINIISNKERLKAGGHLISFSVDNIHAHDIASALGSKGIAVRAGALCAQPIVNLLGFDSLTRVSVAPYVTQENIEYTLREIFCAINNLK
jgi:cysteine desulfurase/selenocysteine lyase